MPNDELDPAKEDEDFYYVDCPECYSHRAKFYPCVDHGTFESGILICSCGYEDEIWERSYG